MNINNTFPRTLTAALVAVLFLLVASPALAQTEPPATVTVFHAVPADDGFPADVYLDGELIIDGFVFETSSESFEVAPGSATLDIYADGSDPNTDSPAVSTPVTFESGSNYSVVAQISAEAPVITVFVNPIDAVGPGVARLTLRQTSAVDTLDLTLDGALVFDDIASTNEASSDIDSGVVQVGVTSGDQSLFDEPVLVENGKLTILYAVGDPGNETFDILIQEVQLDQVAPIGVPTGTGGDRAASPWAQYFATIVGVAALVAFAIGRRIRG